MGNCGNEIVIDGKKYRAVDTEKTRQQILILHRGWIVVGDVEDTCEKVIVHNCKCIRRWGTTKGLGELRNGALGDTVLDVMGTVEVHPLAIVGRINANGY